MLEITNCSKSPIQLIIRSKTGAYLGEEKGFQKTTKGFTTLNIPGKGSGKNIFYLEDEKYTEYIQQAVDNKTIKIKKI